MSVFDDVKALLAEQLDLDEDKITMESTLEDDLKADSIATVELMMELEQKYDLEIPDEQLMTIQTVADVVAYIEQNQ